MSGHTNDLPRPYDSEERDHGVFWSGLAIAVVVGLVVVSFTIYDLTHQSSAIRPILIVALGFVAAVAFVLLLMNIGKKQRAQYAKAGRFAVQMAILMAACIVAMLFLILLP